MIRLPLALLLLALAGQAHGWDEPAPSYGASPSWRPDPSYEAHIPRRGAVLHVLTESDDLDRRRHAKARDSIVSYGEAASPIPKVAAPDWPALARFAREYDPRGENDLRALARSGCKPLDFGYPCRAEVLELYATPWLLAGARREFPWVRQIPTKLPSAAGGVYAGVRFLEGPMRGESLIVPADMLTRLIPPERPGPRSDSTPPHRRTASWSWRYAWSAWGGATPRPTPTAARWPSTQGRRARGGRWPGWAVACRC